MKKPELRQMIREEISVLNEFKTDFRRARKYVNSIKNPLKKQYAKTLLQSIESNKFWYGTSSEEWETAVHLAGRRAGALGYMAKQAVRMQIASLLGPTMLGED